jgi:hypothetical protein
LSTSPATPKPPQASEPKTLVSDTATQAAEPPQAVEAMPEETAQSHNETISTEPEQSATIGEATVEHY